MRKRRIVLLGLEVHARDHHDRIGEFRIGPGGWPKMAGIAHPILHILEHVQEMPFGETSLD